MFAPTVAVLFYPVPTIFSTILHRFYKTDTNQPRCGTDPSQPVPGGQGQCLRTDIQTVFVLYGDICNIPEIVHQIKDAGKIAIVHADLISGLATKEISVDFLRHSTLADGIISTRANMIQRARELNMIAILRVFLIDSMALDSALSAKNLKPDAIDILPGLMPSMLRKVRQMTGLPILTGGLITEKKEVMQALEAGALAISSTAPAVWEM